MTVIVIDKKREYDCKFGIYVSLACLV